MTLDFQGKVTTAYGEVGESISCWM